MKKCFLFTSSFPFGFGETFLETEITYLSKSFDKVVIFALTSDSNITRDIPENVVAFHLNQTKFYFKRIKKIIAGMFHPIFPIDKKNFRGRLACYYKRGTVYRAVKKCFAVIKKEAIIVDSDTLFYSYWLSDTALISLSLRKKMKCDVKCISRAHGSDIYDYAQPIGFNPFQEYIVEHLDYIFPVSNNGNKYLSLKHPTFSKKIITQYLGTKDYGFKIHKISPNKTIVTCSNIIRIKRLDLFAKLFCELHKNNENLRWCCIGDGVELKTIQNIVSDYNAGDYVSFLGKLSNKSILEYYSNHNLSFFVNFSSTEGLPVSVMEAMSFGIPCFATDVGGTNELVNSDNGFLMNANESFDYYRDFFESHLLMGEKEYSLLCYNARKKWQADFNADKNYTSWCILLRRLI